ncbi:MAG: carbohydrate ABC transporter permease [Cuneatibacter sp.]|nr:carbohydrate ABC transporter permease [Cuneatibacter sp.]
MSMKTKKYIFYPLIFVILVLVAITMLFPFVWMVIGSLKPKAELFAVPMKLLPSTWMWKNYLAVFQKIPFFLFYANTAKIAVLSTIGQVVTCSLSAYAFAKLQFKGRDLLFMLYLGTMMIPYQVTMIPQYELMNNFGLLNSHTALILLHCFSPFGVFLLRQFFVSIPDSLIEAARIDGAGDLRILGQIVLPLSKSALATLVTLKFLDSWNEFTGPLIFLNEKTKYTLQIGIRAFQQENGTEYTLILAATTLSLIPIVLIYIFAQKYFIEGIAATGVKG